MAEYTLKNWHDGRIFIVDHNGVCVGLALADKEGATKWCATLNRAFDDGYEKGLRDGCKNPN